MYDYLIVGQGIAGSLIGFRLEQAGQHIGYVDAPLQSAASEVAAGIINPITGRYYVKSWEIDTLLPAARRVYATLESTYQQQFWYPMPLIRTLFNQGDQNQWDVRSGEASYQPYLAEKVDLGRYKQLTHAGFAYAGIQQTGRVALRDLVAAIRRRLRREGRILEELFQYDQLMDAGEYYTYKGIKARCVIFCEGWRGKENPWFNYLPFRGAKGETFLIRLAGPQAQRMLKKRIFLVPQGDQTYWAGATTENHFQTDQPTEANAQWLKNELEQLLRVPYDILAHRAAVRPTVKDRRPFMGQHPEEERLFIFNGLGSKGASLAPLCSQWLVDLLLTAKPLRPEVDIKRYATT
ncbi:MAG: FAD-dependent oxidoreductase [Bacteroidota bacterium]